VVKKTQVAGQEQRKTVSATGAEQRLTQGQLLAGQERQIGLTGQEQRKTVAATGAQERLGTQVAGQEQRKTVSATGAEQRLTQGQLLAGQERELLLPLVLKNGLVLGLLDKSNVKLFLLQVPNNA
jgi:hypothetical protein